jgi:hypothetical protein
MNKIPRQEDDPKPEEAVAIRSDLDYLQPNGVQLRPEFQHVGLLPQLLYLQRNQKNKKLQLSGPNFDRNRSFLFTASRCFGLRAFDATTAFFLPTMALRVAGTGRHGAAGGRCGTPWSRLAAGQRHAGEGVDRWRWS